MGALKVVKALQEHVYIRDANRKVRNQIKRCHICQLVKVNNHRKEGTMMPITSSNRLEKVFVDICGPFPRSGGRHQYKYFIILFDHYTRFTKLYPINRATTQKILNIICQNYISEVGAPKSIITDHGTQFKGSKWKDTLREKGIKTYKTSVYHPSSNPAERVLREVGRILRTYCFNQQRKWAEYLTAAENFINLSHHQFIEMTPYTAMFQRPPPREIAELIQFPSGDEYKFNSVKFYENILERTERTRRKYQQFQPKPERYFVGDKILLKNRELPSTMEGIAKKLLLLYTGPYTVSKDNGNNTYEILDPHTLKKKGTFNQSSIKRYYEMVDDKINTTMITRTEKI